ncbi:hypothetical protein ATOBIA_N13610 [Atopobiaceae bacterium P1]|nr:hypothetical protein ATOBIA_N13610 [Atopobiaceae bacterium P1]
MVSFILAFLLGLCLLMVPGLLLCVASGVGYRAALCLAPGPSVFFYFVVSLFLGFASIDGVAPLAAGVLGLALVVSAAIFLIRKAHPWSVEIQEPSLPIMALYAVFGTLLFVGLFLNNAGGFDWFLQYNDNSAHLTRIKAMVDGATTSPVHSMMYGSNVRANQAPFSDGTSGVSAYTGFYPVAYHNLAALILASGVAPILVAQNAVNAIFCAVAFPLGVCVLLSQISRSDKQLLLCGSVTCGASYAFPLRALVIHQNYPNVVAFCLVPLMVCLLVSAVHSKTEDGSFKLELNRAALALFIVSLIGLVDLHPNAAIACGVIGGCYVIGGLIPAWGRSLPQKPSSFFKFLGLEVGVIALCLGVWVACLLSPVFAATVGFLWEWTIPVSEALKQVALLGLRIEVVQPVLAAVVLVGFIWCVTHKGTGWIALSYGALVAIFFANAVGTADIKKVFAGFFYTDPDRTAALVGLWASVIAAFGLYAVYRGFIKAITAIRDRTAERGLRKTLLPKVALVVCVLFATGNYGEAFAINEYPKDENHIYLGPSRDLPGGAFAWQERELQWVSDPDASMFYNQNDAKFMQRVKRITGAKDLILNIPLDGSMYAYPVDGVNVLYKREITDEDSAQSQAIRLHLNEYATNPQVQQAVKDLDAKYVLQLSAKGPYGANYADYDRNRVGDWVGIASINPDTPGFKLVLSEGDMALYRIEPLPAATKS